MTVASRPCKTGSSDHGGALGFLDWLLIPNCRHFERVLHVYFDHYDTQRPHRALELRPPDLINGTLHAAQL